MKSGEKAADHPLATNLKPLVTKVLVLVVLATYWLQALPLYNRYKHSQFGSCFLLPGLRLEGFTFVLALLPELPLQEI